ncbi:glyoxalase family protein [Penicillium frequentans]|uniref:Glyoxalase family protein n=1 Tax=Penicillium frequentans TaxID=3151616 RepID=A0AAD6D520_9EURO|nr:glyoxalase family protein [Penicillium glabrum]
MTEPSEVITAVEFLAKTAGIIDTIRTNLLHNRLDRKEFQRLLSEYSNRAESDGKLMNAARQEPHCANRGLFLAYNHMECLSWLDKHNYTIPSSSVKWYSWKQILGKNRIPIFWSSSPTVELQALMKNIERTAALVCADLKAHNISIPETSVKYLDVPIGEHVATPPTEAYEDLLARGIAAQKRLAGTKVGTGMTEK